MRNGFKMNMIIIKSVAILMLAILEVSVFAISEVRIKELAEVRGARGNQLFGYGLVVGLNGTGDKTQTVFTSQSLTNMLDKLGVAPSKVSKFGLSTSGSEMKVKNVAAVLVTAELTPFTSSGTRIDVTVSSIGDCNSLEGGTLVMTPLQGADGKIYAVAQGPVSVGGLAASVSSPTHPTVANIVQGAFVEREVPANFVKDGKITLLLRNPDFTTSNRIADAINKTFAGIAKSIDAGTIEVKIADEYKDSIISFISAIEQLSAKGDIEAKVVINERTGTIVTGENVTISAVAVSHGTLTVSISPEKAAGDTTVGETIALNSKVMFVPESVSIGQVAKSLSVLGATPTDMIAIFQAMKRAGAINAKLEIM